MLTYISTEKNIHKEINADDTGFIISAFSNKDLYKNIPTGTFSDNLSIEIDGNFYNIECTNGDRVKDVSADKCFSLSNQESTRLRSIFEAYGGTFPYK